jgi:hypothetical protein
LKSFASPCCHAATLVSGAQGKQDAVPNRMVPADTASYTKRHLKTAGPVRVNRQFANRQEELS